MKSPKTVVSGTTQSTGLGENLSISTGFDSDHVGSGALPNVTASVDSGTPLSIAAVPMRSIGPIKITGQVLQEEVSVPLATYESPLWPSTNRGATISRLAGGIRVTLLDERMTRSILLEAPTAEDAYSVTSGLTNHRAELEAVVAQTSRFARLIDWHVQIVGKLIFIRFAMSTGDAAGHNMTTQAADAMLQWIVERHPQLEYVSVTGNYCTDKKVSAVNGILGRGKYVVAELEIPRTLCQQRLRTTPEKIVALNIKKNLIGSIAAGGLRSANAHFANMLLGFYLATGQDGANIVEGSQGIVYAEIKQAEQVGDVKQAAHTKQPGNQTEDCLYFSVTLPNIIVGTVGNGKDLEFVKQNLQTMGCLEERLPGENARRLAAIAAATVLCGELSLLAAQTNPGELMKSHLRLERLEGQKQKQRQNQHASQNQKQKQTQPFTQTPSQEVNKPC